MIKPAMDMLTAIALVEGYDSLGVAEEPDSLESYSIISVRGGPPRHLDGSPPGEWEPYPFPIHHKAEMVWGISIDGKQARQICGDPNKLQLLTIQYGHLYIVGKGEADKYGFRQIIRLPGGTPRHVDGSPPGKYVPYSKPIELIAIPIMVESDKK